MRVHRFVLLALGLVSLFLILSSCSDEDGQSIMKGTITDTNGEPLEGAAILLSFQPTVGEPVKLSSFKRSSVVNRSAPSRWQGRIENAPRGKSVSARISPIRSAPTGVRLAGFNTKGQPAAMAGAILWAARFRGKLKGEMKEHGPMGTRLTMPR